MRGKENCEKLDLIFSVINLMIAASGLILVLFSSSEKDQSGWMKTAGHFCTGFSILYVVVRNLIRGVTKKRS